MIPIGNWSPPAASTKNLPSSPPPVFRRNTKRLFLVFLSVSLLAACSQFGTPPPSPSQLPAIFGIHPASYADLTDWQRDDHAEAFGVFLYSCQKIVRQPSGRRLGKDGLAGTIAHWRQICEAGWRLGPGLQQDSAKRFFEHWFTPYRLADNENPQGLFTGYYEPELRGSRVRSARYNVPLYRRPSELITVDLGRFSSEMKGRQIAGKVQRGVLAPFDDRASIAQGSLAGRDLELLWVDDPIDAFFLQIQGSGRVVMDSGELVRVGYAARNGHAYFAIGRDLVKAGKLTKENVSLQSIRAWLKAHPGQADQLMNKNRSYIFFREIKGASANIGPIGAQGIPLTPLRSLAIDRKYLPLGAPLWLETTDPLRPHVPLRRLVIAQDTGGAITGPVRGDLFWGAGTHAARAAGQMKQPGRLHVLLPRSLAKDLSH